MGVSLQIVCATINVVRYEPHFVLIHDILKPFEFVAGFIVSDETFQDSKRFVWLWKTKGGNCMGPSGTKWDQVGPSVGLGSSFIMASLNKCWANLVSLNYGCLFV